MRREQGPRSRSGRAEMNAAICPTLRAGANSTGGDRPPGTDVDTCESLIVLRHSGGGNSDAIDTATTLSAKGGVGRLDFESETFVAHTLRADGFDASEDGTGRGIALVPVAFDTTQITSPTNRCNPQPGDPAHPLASTAHAPAVAIPILEAGARTGKSTDDPRAGMGIGECGDPMYTLQSGKQYAVAFSCKDSGADAAEIAPTLRSMNFDKSHANAGGQLAVALHARQDPDVSREVTHPLDTDGSTNAVAVNLGGRAEGARPEISDVASLRSASGGSSRSYAATAYAVRRLTPVECERLQGFRDGYTAITHRGKPAADGPRYRALGNSMAVPVIRWIGERIQKADQEQKK
jgi:DNA (cytosine-5)-methyltransferase 1